MADVDYLHTFGYHLLSCIRITGAEENVFAMLLCRLDDLVNSPHGLLRITLVWHPQGTREIVGTEDHAVKSRHTADLINVLQRLHCLYHYANKDITVCCLQVVRQRDASIIHGSCRAKASTEAVGLLNRARLSNVIWWLSLASCGVAAVSNDATHLCCCPNLRDGNAISVGVKSMLDEHAPGQAYTINSIGSRHPHKGWTAFAMCGHDVPF
mmetsp:Transcript_98398/g.175211  ORF Transcript_98398/g.175211 Transcript_98398/m.175211 type:complete len:211 (+) Transcript_98398:142-774(+)|eukprot:CAMPEP_0197665528 /NCGR_PEP_ID=MMETSP1338-20131121/59450_1 /TAXON_ID=43686 ORGANISM="Pelagodinium beii, Strain RCC1491" /NCGR_SAMPLE_ID=MMETSP1338 /ASSEMBLY_ACC=CAM_ASM_000754 /LENGTH=210 /DNA_ID=CAMNT_0043244353 /DNA_START=54 /DNA_END=686 /DNA_ORIENTATION=+